MKNIFDGESYQAQFALAIYKRLMTRKPFTYADVMADYLGEKLTCNVSKCDQYGELKKAFDRVRKAIAEKLGKDGIKTIGHNRNREYLYVGDNPNPLEGMMAAQFKKDLVGYYQFCQDSAGFFPDSWIEHFFAKTLDLFEMKNKRKQNLDIMGTSANRMLTNIELLPFVYECIRDKQVLEVTYREGYKKTLTTVIFYPHYLKEFNGGWHIFGHAEGKKPSDAFDISLDRIVGEPKVIHDAEYIEPQDVKYPDYFDDIVGTTHDKDRTLYSITIRIHTEYMFGLMKNKPIHHSQKIVLPYDKERGYGEVQMELCPNKEFYGRVLQFGAELEIVSPDEVRRKIAGRIYYMYNRYKDESNCNGS